MKLDCQEFFQAVLLSSDQVSIPVGVEMMVVSGSIYAPNISAYNWGTIGINSQLNTAVH